MPEIPYEMIHVRRDRAVAANGWPLHRWVEFQNGVREKGFEIIARDKTEWGDIIVIEKHMGDHYRVIWYGPDRKRPLTFSLLSERHRRVDTALRDARAQYRAHKEALEVVG